LCLGKFCVIIHLVLLSHGGNMTHPLLKDAVLQKLADRTIAGKRKLLSSGDNRHPDVLFDIAFNAALSEYPEDITDTLKGRIKSAVGLILSNRRHRKIPQQTQLLFQFRHEICREKKTIMVKEINELVDFHYRYDDQRLFFTSITGSTRVSERFQWEANLHASSVFQNILNEELLRVLKTGDDFITLMVEGTHHLTFFIEGRKLRFSFWKLRRGKEHTISASLFESARSFAESHFGLGESLGPLFKTM
jgi:hypothetical protein